MREDNTHDKQGKVEHLQRQLTHLREAIQRVEGEQTKATTRHNEYDSAQLGLNRWMVRFTAALFFAAVVGGVIAGIQSQLLRDSNRINREGLQAVQRAYIHFIGIPNIRISNLPNPPNSKGFQFTPEWENSGTTPAWDTKGEFAIGTELPTSEEQFIGPVRNLPGTTVEARGKHRMAPITKLDSFFFPPQTIYAHEHGLKHDADSSDNKVYAWGWIGYHDVFEGTPLHVTEFCVSLSGINHTGSFTSDTYAFRWEQCREHNCIDRYCKDYADIKRFLE